VSELSPLTGVEVKLVKIRLDVTYQVALMLSYVTAVYVELVFVGHA